MKNNKNKDNNFIGDFTFRLFNEPSFMDGVTSLINFEKLIFTYHTDKTDEQADGNSIRSDWEAVGSDIKNALTEYERKSTINSSK